MSESRSSFESLVSQVESRRKRVVLYTTLPLLAILAVLFVVLLLTARNVKGDFDQLKSERAELRSQKDEIIGEKQQVEEQKRQVEEQKKELNVILQQIYDRENKAGQQNIKRIIETKSTLPSVAARIYVHIHDEGKRPQARKVTAALQNAGYVVPGIEKRPEVVNSTEVRFFNAGDEKTANKVAAIMREQGLSDAEATLSTAKAPQGQIEIWFKPLTMAELNSRIGSLISRVGGAPEGQVTRGARLSELGIVDDASEAMLISEIVREFGLKPADMAGVRLREMKVWELFDYVFTRLTKQ